MDYLVFSSLHGHAVKRLVLSYDIACQWYKNIKDRMFKVIPRELWMDRIVEEITYLVPKFHLPAHVTDCQLNFSFNYTKHVGRTDGEAPERGWSRTNQLATSTREMGPGFRRDTLDDHFNDWNWKKITALGMSYCLPYVQVLKPTRRIFEGQTRCRGSNDQRANRPIQTVYINDGRR